MIKSTASLNFLQNSRKFVCFLGVLDLLTVGTNFKPKDVTFFSTIQHQHQGCAGIACSLNIQHVGNENAAKNQVCKGQVCHTLGVVNKIIFYFILRIYISEI